MAKRYELEVSETEREQLNRWLKNPPRLYLRERARYLTHRGWTADWLRGAKLADPRGTQCGQRLGPSLSKAAA